MTANPDQQQPNQHRSSTMSPTDSNGSTAEVVTITPKMAEEWLGRNTHNRRLHQSRVDNLVGAIQRGEWMFNGDAIRFADDGTLLDGQHRLWAVVMADEPITAVVIDGLHADSQETMDRGAKRNLKDALELRGEKNTSRLAASINYFWRYTNGLVRTTSATPSVAQALELLDAHPELREFGLRSENVRGRFALSSAMVAVAWYELASIDIDLADNLFDNVVGGENLRAGDPVYALRRYLETHSVGRERGARAQAYYVHALIIKTWNAMCEGRPLDKLSWRMSGMNAEPFPVPIAPNAGSSS